MECVDKTLKEDNCMSTAVSRRELSLGLLLGTEQNNIDLDRARLSKVRGNRESVEIRWRSISINQE